MARRIALIVMACGFAIVGLAQAQELRCTQVFMNASEKRICASPELMQLDQQMGELGRRVEPHQDSPKSDQRRFRKALKTCAGDASCLATSYGNRITELQTYIETLAPPTAEEITSLDEGAARAEQKRLMQGDTRARITQELAGKDAEATVEPVENEVIEWSEPDQVAHQEEVPVGPVVERVPASSELESRGEASWGTWALIAIFAFGLIAWIRAWAHKAFKRCPKCKNWNAGTVIDSDSDSYTDYETKTFNDVHKDRQGVRTGSTSKTRQVAVRVTNTLDYLRCKICNEKWTIATQRRSG